MAQRTEDRPGRARGVFVTLEGVDGAGKTTQCALLCAAVERAGREAVRLREPGGTAVGERIRALLLDASLGEMDPGCELLLFEAARRQLVAQVVRPALARGAVVVCDRFFDSTSAYQGWARGLGEDVVARANELACDGVRPDRTLLLELPSGLALGRAVATSGEADRMEAQGAPFAARVAEGYAHVAAREPARVRRVDASGTPEQVHARVLAELADLLRLPGGAAGEGCFPASPERAGVPSKGDQR